MHLFYTYIGEPEGKHVVIVDDLVQTGGTLIQCGKVKAFENSVSSLIFDLTDMTNGRTD